MRLALDFALYGVAGYFYLCVIGAAAAPWLLPRRWLPHWPGALPLIGWGTVVAVAYPLNATVPGRWALIALGGAAGLLVVWHLRACRLTWLPPRRVAWAPLVAGVVMYMSGAALYIHAGTLSALVADSDVEHFADVIQAMLKYPIGWSAEAQTGLEATPVGLAYHYVHASISAVTGADAFSTAMPSHLLMLTLAPGAVYIFARDGLRLNGPPAAVASALFAAGGLSLGVAGFGWGQQTAAIATLPIAIAALRRALASTDRKSLLCGGVLGMLGAGSLYLASAPIVGGFAVVFAATLIKRSAAFLVVQRTAAVAIAVGAAGLLSHVSAVTFLFERLGAGLLRADELTGRSTHVTTFASLPAWLGVAPLDLFSAGVSIRGAGVHYAWPSFGPMEQLHASVAALVLCTFGVVSTAKRRRLAVLLAVLLPTAMLELYLRVLRPFPYGEFKLFSSVWFIVPVVVAAGFARLSGLSNHGRVAWRIAAVACLGLFAAGVSSAHVQTRVLLAGPWGAMLPENEMRAARTATSAIPPGEPVWVSNQLAPEAAVRWQGTPTDHRAGFPTREAGAQYLATRWRGIVTSLLAFSGRPVYGTVQRHSHELRAPLDPRDAGVVILDEAEDPMLFGLVRGDLLSSVGRLRVYRQANRDQLSGLERPLPSETGLDVPAPAPSDPRSAILPAVALPIGESLPGRRQGFTVRSRVDPTVLTTARVTSQNMLALALFSPREREIEVQTEDWAQRMLLFPGVTWVAARGSIATSGVRVTPGKDYSETLADLRVVAAVRLEASDAPESIWRSPAGVAAPFVAVQSAGDHYEVLSTNLSQDLVSSAMRLRRSDALWLRGRPSSPDFTLDALVRLQEVTASAEKGDWIWLEIGAPARPALSALPLSGPGVSPTALPKFAVGPLIGMPAALPIVQDGSLVKGSSRHFHLVERGKLRWVTGLDVLQRRGLSPSVVTLRDEELWRLPVSQPLE